MYMCVCTFLFFLRLEMCIPLEEKKINATEYVYVNRCHHIYALHAYMFIYINTKYARKLFAHVHMIEHAHHCVSVCVCVDNLFIHVFSVRLMRKKS